LDTITALLNHIEMGNVPDTFISSLPIPKILHISLDNLFTQCLNIETVQQPFGIARKVLPLSCCNFVSFCCIETGKGRHLF